METPKLEIDKSEYPSLWGRITFAVKLFMYVLRNKPLVACLNEGMIYARSNPYYLRVYASMLADLAEHHEMIDLESQIRRLLIQEEARKN